MRHRPAPRRTPHLRWATSTAPPRSCRRMSRRARERLKQCWNPPVGTLDAGRLKVVLRVVFKQDGSLAAPPQLIAGSASSFGPTMAESATRAILTCQPFKMLRPETYQHWKDMEITFEPREMVGG